LINNIGVERIISDLHKARVVNGLKIEPEYENVSPNPARFDLRP